MYMIRMYVYTLLYIYSIVTIIYFYLIYVLLVLYNLFSRISTNSFTLYLHVDCGIPNCILCDKVDNRCIHCKSGYRLTSDGKCEGDYNTCVCTYGHEIQLTLLAIIKLKFNGFLKNVARPTN